ncbi:hypothetical protein BDN70DRAFT_991829 [Pholiota conissans]|uniref:Uncharacterized protein n=1 Tax=Pholiota conissans TaxID=109636 RepID=A0A9P6D3F1_9AGAR|nr:hypothetical protein BDN70DRAFT_991829 [Pholiota conissans]
MSSTSVIAGRDTMLAGRALCDASNPDCKDHSTFVKVQVIYIIVATAVFLLGSALSIFLIVRQRRKWRQQREKMGGIVVVPENAPTYDPSVGRPSQNVWAEDAHHPPPPPTYSHV